jgi:hypothetical protein
MNTMVDEIYDRHYQEGRQALHDGLDRLFGWIGGELGKSLAAIHRFEWDAPWSRRAKPRGKRSPA